MIPDRHRKKGSCGDETQWCFMPNRKLLAKGFLWLWHAAAPCRSRHFERSEAESRNLLPEGFPMAVTRSSPTPSPSFRAQRSGVEKSAAPKGFLFRCTLWPHAGQETIGEGFPMVMTRSEPTPDRKLYENKNPLLHGEDFLISHEITGRIWRRFRPRA